MDYKKALQNDLLSVFSWAKQGLSIDMEGPWAKQWDMSFNVLKCCHLTITKKTKSKITTAYGVNNQEIPKVKSCKYLGLTITNDLSWNEHTANTRNKAARTLGVIRRNLGPCSQEVKAKAYEALVRPQLEYATAAWNPHTNRNAKSLEGIQRQAARFVKRDYKLDSSVTTMVNQLGWDTLKERRLMVQATMFYKIRYSIVNILIPSYVKVQSSQTRRQHPLQYQHIYTRVDTFKYSLFPRIVPIWNILPVAAVTAETVASFRTAAWPTIRATVLSGKAQ